VPRNTGGRTNHLTDSEKVNTYFLLQEQIAINYETADAGSTVDIGCGQQWQQLVPCQ
jgi:hypothetical protein